MFLFFHERTNTDPKIRCFYKRKRPNFPRVEVQCSPWRSSREMWETRRRILLRILLRLEAECGHQTAHFNATTPICSLECRRR
jgi:hypothetical protein